MADVFWTLNFYMKDAPSGEKFIEERMNKDLICYFDIIGLIEKQGYTSMDYIYCKRNGHGRHRSELVEIISDLDVSRMVCEHEVDQKLSFYVAKQTDGLNTGIRRSGQVPIGASADAERRKALSDERVTESDYDTESSHETDHEAQGVEHHAGLEDIKRRRVVPNVRGEGADRQIVLDALKRRRSNPNVGVKRNKRLRNSRFQSEDDEHEEEDVGDLDDPLEPREDGEEDDDVSQDSPIHSENEDQNLGKPDTTISGVSPESGSIKIIWPNGVVQEYRGRFIVSNVMNIKSGGKVLVETDGNGIPNQRSAGLLGSFLRDLAKSSSHVPLHIPRWDNKLMKKPKQDLITYVETKFMYPEETKYTTEGWMLKIVNKGWRAHKSFLKSEYYKPNKLSLDRIKRRVPSGVNKHQWITLLGTWCQEQHAKTCQRNSEAGKQQRHPHTTGRKSHARLKKKMEVKNKGPVSKIDLWDEAHKKKDGKYTNENVQQLMHKARKELAILERKKNGELSLEDYDKVFDDVIAKETTIGGYYDEKYWGDAKLCQGSTSVQGSSSEVRVQKELQEMKADLKRVTGCMERMYAFMARNHPDEDWLNEVMDPGNIKTGGQPEEDPAPRLQYNNVAVNVISDKVGGGHEVDCVEEPMDNVHTTKSDPKEAQFGNNPTSKDPVNRTGKASTMKESPEQTSHQVNVSKRDNNVVIHQKVTETAKSNEVVQTLSKNTKFTRAAEDKIHSQNSTHEQRFVKASETKEISECKTAQKKPKTMVLLSLVPRTKDLVVGKGIIKSRDSNYVVEGDTIGDSYWAITVLEVSKLGRERLPRPFGHIQTVQDAIGHCIAWPTTHVKRVKDVSN